VMASTSNNTDLEKQLRNQKGIQSQILSVGLRLRDYDLTSHPTD
jgi:hypothetical protein